MFTHWLDSVNTSDTFHLVFEDINMVRTSLHYFIEYSLRNVFRSIRKIRCCWSNLLLLSHSAKIFASFPLLPTLVHLQGFQLFHKVLRLIFISIADVESACIRPLTPHSCFFYFVGYSSCYINLLTKSSKA